MKFCHVHANVSNKAKFTQWAGFRTWLITIPSRRHWVSQVDPFHDPRRGTIEHQLLDTVTSNMITLPLSSRAFSWLSHLQYLASKLDWYEYPGLHQERDRLAALKYKNYCRRQWIQRSEFKIWTGLYVFPFVLMEEGLNFSHLFSHNYR